jgi:PAS domain S-box-containing protein
MGQAELNYRSLFNNMLNGLAYCKVLDTGPLPHDFVFLEVNPAFERLTGLKDVVGKRATEVIPGLREKDPDLLETYSQVAASGEPRRFERYIQALKLWFLVTVYSPARGHFVSIFDATDEKWEAKDGRGREERLRSIMAAMSEGLVLHDAGGAIVTCNDAAERLLGLTRAQLEGRTPTDPRWRSVHEDDSPFPGDEHPAVVSLRSGTPVSSVIMGVHKPDGTLTWLSVNAEPLRTAPGEAPYAVVATFTDVTERQLQARHLRESEARLAAVIDGSNDGSVDIDVRSGEVYRSEKYWEIAGWPSGSRRPTSESFLELIHPDDSDRVRSVAAALMEGTVERLEEEYRLRTSVGTWSWVRARLRIVARDTAGRPARIAGAISDTDAQHRQQERALSEARLRGLSCRMNETELLMGLDGIILETNDRASELYGRTREQLIGHHVRELRAPGTRHQVEAQMANASAGGVRFETEHVRLDGTSFPVEVSSRTFESGGATYLHSLIRDLSEQRRKETELERSEEHFRRLVLLAPVPIAYVHQGGVLEINRAFTRVLGYGQEDVPNLEAWFQKAYPEESYRRQVVQSWSEALGKAAREGGEAPLTEYQVTGKDGAVRSMLIGGVPVEEDQIAVLLDVTARKVAEEALRQASNYARSLIEASLDPLVTISPEGKVTDVNRATEAVTGLGRDRIIGNDFADYFTEPGQAWAGYRRALARGAVRDYPLTVRSADGGTTEVLYNAAVYAGPDGTVQGIFAAARDVTQVRALQARLASTSRLAALGTLVAGLAHEINNPLAVEQSNQSVALERVSRLVGPLRAGPGDPAPPPRGGDAGASGRPDRRAAHSTHRQGLQDLRSARRQAEPGRAPRGRRERQALAARERPPGRHRGGGWRRASGAGGVRPDRAGRGQPGDQRRQGHAARPPCTGRGPDRARKPRHGAARGHRPWDRDRPGHPRPDLRALLHHPRGGAGDGARPRRQPLDRHGPRRHHLGGERAGPGLDVPGRAAGGGSRGDGPGGGRISRRLNVEVTALRHRPHAAPPAGLELLRDRRHYAHDQPHDGGAEVRA